MPGTNFFDTYPLIDVALSDEFGNAILAKCLVANIPSGTAGFAEGCEIIATDTGAHYYNTGSATSCTFVVGGTIGALSITTASIQANAVTLAKLATGITPSHVVKFAGKITWSGSGASLATTVAGVAATDIVLTTIQTVPTQAAYILSAAPTTNTITIVLSAANTSNDAVIAYQVLRAVS